MEACGSAFIHARIHGIRGLFGFLTLGAGLRQCFFCRFKDCSTGQGCSGHTVHFDGVGFHHPARHLFNGLGSNPLRFVCALCRHIRNHTVCNRQSHRHISPKAWRRCAVGFSRCKSQGRKAQDCRQQDTYQFSHERSPFYVCDGLRAIASVPIL